MTESSASAMTKNRIVILSGAMKQDPEERFRDPLARQRSGDHHFHEQVPSKTSDPFL
jgi:hypothetical protein